MIDILAAIRPVEALLLPPMKTFLRLIGHGLFTIAAVLSLLLCIGAATLAISSDHLYRKQVRVGQLEAFWHHDLIIISWGPVEFTGEAQSQWSIDESWIGFDADVVNVGGQRWKWLFTLNSTQVGMMGITAVLPGIWILRYFWKNREADAGRNAI